MAGLHHTLKQSQSRDQRHRKEEQLAPFLSGNHVLNCLSDTMMYISEFHGELSFVLEGVPVHAGRRTKIMVL